MGSLGAMLAATAVETVSSRSAEIEQTLNDIKQLRLGRRNTASRYQAKASHARLLRSWGKVYKDSGYPGSVRRARLAA
jgi:hypothetical protein